MGVVRWEIHISTTRSHIRILTSNFEIGFHPTKIVPWCGADTNGRSPLCVGLRKPDYDSICSEIVSLEGKIMV